MRFLADGPSIPDSLLESCDQGRVVFLCGAGVSFPSGMPGFVELTRHVIKSLEPPEDSPVLSAFGVRIEDNYKPCNEDGPLVPLDQVFHILYQEYDRQEVNAIVAERLNTEDFSTPSLEHSLISRISSDPEGRPQIVTTNFDRLFDKCPGITEGRIFEPPALPDIELGMPIFGVSYLHGRLKAPEFPIHDYILSSADFGRAYLAQGWATNFIRALLDKYTVVLTGYQAEDPPVKYLLQGLNHEGRNVAANIYAFDKGDFEDIEVKWRDLGVTPIAYSDHKDLWATMEAWAKRSDDPRSWRSDVVEMARRGPRELAPHERGQVAHLVRSVPGARLFAQSKPPPTVEWLNVFDANCRAAKKSNDYDEDAVEFDPLEAYGLDDDAVRPPEIELGGQRMYDHLLEWRRGDINPASGHSLSGRKAVGWEDMPSRLYHIMSWSAMHLDKPIFAWWAARQHRLHPRHTKEIRRQLRVMVDLHPTGRRVWNLILEALTDPRAAPLDQLWFEFADKVKNYGWTNDAVRAFDQLMAPNLVCKYPFGVKESMPPQCGWEDVSASEITRWEISFPERLGNDLRIPDEALPDVFLIAERHLTHAVKLHEDIGTKNFTTPTCYPQRYMDGEDEDGNSAIHFRWFLSLVDRMAERHPEILKWRVLGWDHGDHFFFRKLKLFALNDSRLFEANEAANTVLAFSQDEFWDYEIRRELLFLIVDRWPSLTQQNRISIADKLLAVTGNNSEQITNQNNTSNPENMAFCYTRWLELQGCEFPEDQAVQIANMISNNPEWTDERATSIIIQYGIHGGTVSVDNNPDKLIGIPLGEVTARATAESGFDHQSLTEFKPFEGLVSSNPLRALAALSYEARFDRYHEEYWRALFENWPEDVSLRLNSHFLHRVARLPSEVMQELSYPLANWIKNSFQSLYEDDEETAWKLFDAVVSGIISNDNTAIDRLSVTSTDSQIENISRRTFDHAMNSPFGQLTLGLLGALKSTGPGIPEAFIIRIEFLLAASGECRDHTVAVLVRELRWLYQLDREWIMDRMMPWFAFSHSSSEPAWNAYFSAAAFPPAEVGRHLKPMLMRIFPTIYDWSWNRSLAKIAAQMVIELAIFRREDADGLLADEARNCIRNMSDTNRKDAIFRLSRIGQREDDGWTNYVIPFIDSAWPRERRFRTTEMVSAWINLLDDTGDEFPRVLGSVRKFLVPVERDNHWLYRFAGDVGGMKPLTAEYPSAVLDMLDAIVSNDPQNTPVELSPILDIIESNDPALVQDRRYIRLVDLVEMR